MNTDTHNYYMVLVRDKNNLENVYTDFIYSNKKIALKNAKKYDKTKYKIEILIYTGTSEDQLRNYWNTIKI